MGLAPYGNAECFSAVFDEIIHYNDEGLIDIPFFRLNQTEIDRQAHRAFRKKLVEMTFPERSPSDEIVQYHIDFAAALQQALQKAMLHILSYWQQKTGIKHICMAGGVALNCTANGVIFRKNIFDKMYVQPAASDAGTSLGAAIVQSYKKNVPLNALKSCTMPYWGTKYSNEICRENLQLFNHIVNYHYLSDEEIINNAAQAICDGMIIAWFQGGLEFGPRALGNRSILANPKDPDMRDKINALVKKREGFRPFAPSVNIEVAHKYFDIPKSVEFPHMLFAVPVRAYYRDKLPAITHVDGSARLQTVNPKVALRYWQLIKRVGEISGFEMVLNTSFNVKGQPMVNTPLQAIETFLNAKLDMLFLNNFLVVAN